MVKEVAYRQDPIRGGDYFNFGGERVPIRDMGYRVEMSAPRSPFHQVDVQFVIPADSPKEAADKARKRYPRYSIVSVRADR